MRDTASTVLGVGVGLLAFGGIVGLGVRGRLRTESTERTRSIMARGAFVAAGAGAVATVVGAVLLSLS